jgi:SAM-dependent methyltransferase
MPIMDPQAIRAKFGDYYIATERTHRLGIDIRIARRVARRFEERYVLETCTGAGFTTIALAQVASHVTTVEIDPNHQAQAKANVARARLSERVTFIEGDALSDEVLRQAQGINAAFLDPDWAVTGPEHVYKFLRSNMRPPADDLLQRILLKTQDIALVLPPFIDLQELESLTAHELQTIYLEGAHALYCVYLGAVATTVGRTEMHT